MYAGWSVLSENQIALGLALFFLTYFLRYVEYEIGMMEAAEPSWERQGQNHIQLAVYDLRRDKDTLFCAVLAALNPFSN
ncbi:hypothetical protein ACFL6S_01825 [Candidatus Poribacteria bacterium]